MGFPIRKSADQRLFAPPHGLSQRTTSFIASQRQGIHRIPLRHLIALIIDAHRSAAAAGSKPGMASIEKTICFKHIQECRGQATFTAGCSNASNKRSPRLDMFPFHDVRQQGARPWPRQTLHSRNEQAPPGGARRDRTDDLMLAKHALSQLSYDPEAEKRTKMVGLGRLELPTSRLSSARSNQLSYKPELYARPASFAGRLVLEEERETKTAAVPPDRPDWPFCSKSFDSRADGYSPKPD